MGVLDELLVAEVDCFGQCDGEPFSEERVEALVHAAERCRAASRLRLMEN